MTDELNLDRKLGFRVGFLVQLANKNTETDKEGILVAIYRHAPRQHFRFAVDWQDGSAPKDYSSKEITRTNFADYPQWDSSEAAKHKWQPGDDHYWIKFGSSEGGSCLYCGKMRGYMAVNNDSLCNGPVRVTLR